MARPTAGERGAPAPALVGAAVSTATDGGTVTIRIGGTLDGVTAIAMLDALREVLDQSPTRVDVDLAGLAGYTDAGIAALATCRTLATRLPDGLHYCTEGGAGQEALLAAFASDAAVDADR